MLWDLLHQLLGKDPNATVIIPCSESQVCSVAYPFIFSAIVLAVIVTGFAYTTLLERVLIARFQHRVGPNRVGPWGLLQPAADGVKLIFKEDIMPDKAYKWVWRLAPMLKAIPTLIVIAVIPLGPPIIVPWFDGNWYRIPLGLADVNVGVLWILAITSIATYGVVLAGWASNNKYAMLGGLRASAQMISYELSLGLTMSVPILIVGSMNVQDIVNAQASPPILGWFVFQNPLAAAILFIALLAEINRAPFDLPEAEQELTAGFMTEYSGMRFALFMMSEYLGMIGMALIVSALYFGGYHAFLVNEVPIMGLLVTIGKVVLWLVFMIWIRATLPRIRYDRLMSFGWKVMLPLALAAVGWTAVSLTVGDVFQNTLVYGVASGLLFVAVVIGAMFYLTRAGQVAAETEEAIESDPIITGERRGIGPLLLQVVGGLIAIPFLLLNLLIKVLESVEKVGQRPEPAEAAPAAEKPQSKPAAAEE